MEPILGMIGGVFKAEASALDPTNENRAALLRQQAALEKTTLEENMRRLEGSQTQVLSSTKARMAASGFDSGSASFSNYLSGMGEQFQAQDKFMMERGEQSLDLQEEAAKLTGQFGLAKWLDFGANLLGAGGSAVQTGKL